MPLYRENDGLRGVPYEGMPQFDDCPELEGFSRFHWCYAHQKLGERFWAYDSMLSSVCGGVDGEIHRTYGDHYLAIAFDFSRHFDSMGYAELGGADMKMCATLEEARDFVEKTVAAFWHLPEGGWCPRKAG